MAVSSRRKSDGLGSPTGRAARTMRLAGDDPWDMGCFLLLLTPSPACCWASWFETRRKGGAPHHEGLEFRRGKNRRPEEPAKGGRLEGRPHTPARLTPR